MTAVLAHQGGWDEILLVALPIAIFAGLLAVANRRATRMAGSGRPGEPDQADRADEADGTTGTVGPPDAPPPTP